MDKSQVYSLITEKIIENLQTSGSWKQLWRLPSPVSLHGHYYRGINRLILGADKYKSRVYGTFAQIRSNGGVVRKGERSTTVVFYKAKVETDRQSGEEKRKVILRYFRVFNTEQADFDQIGAEKINVLQNQTVERHNARHVEAETIIENFIGKPDIHFSETDDRAYYHPIADIISMPPIEYFESSSAFYHVLFHELAHSTGHPTRLDRSDAFGHGFGTELYSKEELVAELCSSYLTDIANIDLDIRNSAAYIAGWSDVLRDNIKWITWAAARAQRAADYILGIRSDEQAPEGIHEEVVEPAIAE